MKIHSLSSLISIPFVLVSFILAYFVFFHDRADLFVFLLIFVLISVTIYMFQPQIDFYWYKKHPLSLPEKEKLLLNSVSSFYKTLNDENKIKFEERIYVFMRSKDFKWVRKEQKPLPQDMKLLIAGSAIQISMNLDDYLYADFDNYFIYSHPFPSPNKQFLHSVEVNTVDKMAIFNIDLIIKAQNPKNKYFNIGLFAFVEIFIHLHPEKVFPDININTFWDKIKSILGIDKDKIIAMIGYEPESLIPVLVTVFFMNRSGFKTQYPKVHDKLCTIFNIRV